MEKLVRDHVPDLARADGRSLRVRTLDDAEFSQALRSKVVEEALEVAAAKDADELTAELADLREVIAALIRHEGISDSSIEEQVARKREDRGGFERRLCMQSFS